jgi:hypothetical protein
LARDKRPFGTIRRLPSERYQAQYTNTAGRRVPAPKTFATRIDAEAYLADRRREIERAKYNPGAVRRPKVTFGDYATGWLAGRHAAGRPIKTRTREHYAAILEDHLLPTFGSRALAAITPADVRAWHAAPHIGRPAHAAQPRLQPDSVDHGVGS